MREIKIKYNPYRLETTILIDGVPPKKNSRLNVADCRLQEWIEDLPEILRDECSSRDFKVIFHGTILDFEDVEAMAWEAKKKNINMKLEHIPAKEISEKESAIDEIFKEIQEGPFDELKQPDVIRSFNLAKSKDFEVNVVATMSAGKSTLINALLGQKLMPSKQEACTATITEVKDNDADHFTAEVYDSNGKLVQTHQNLSLEVMKSLNDNKEVSRIHIEGNIPFVTSEDVALVLVDTPGPNNSRDPEHKAATYRMLSESSKTVVLYVLNATQLGVNDDYNLLKYVADSMKVGGKQSRDRFIFVVNKLDDFKKNDDSVEATIKEIREYLHDNGIDNANIYPASALTALNIRTILSESDDDKDYEVYEAKGKVMKFNTCPEMHFENLVPLPPSARGEIEKRLAKAREKGDVNEEALIHCGIIPIEMAIKTYVQKYAKTAKIKNIVDTFSKRLESAQSFEIIKKEIAENQDKWCDILNTIGSIKQKINSAEDAKRFRERVEQINYDSEIRKAVDDMLVAVQNNITAQISEDNRSDITPGEAEERCKELAKVANNIQTDVQVKLEDLIENYIYKNIKDLFEEYRKKISGLAQEVNAGGIFIDPFALMMGDISLDVSTMLSELTESKRVEVDKKWVKNKKKKWYKPLTWLQKKGHWEGIYENREYIDSTKLTQRFFAPVQEQLHENSNNAIAYAKEQKEAIKQEFYKRFAELDGILKNKLEELQKCSKDKNNVEREIREAHDKLKWLEKIQEKTKEILDI